jgi:hypothetical protein
MELQRQSTNASHSYTYDIENRLVSSSEGAALVYDPLGRLYRVSDATHDTRSSTTATRWSWNMAPTARWSGATSTARAPIRR